MSQESNSTDSLVSNKSVGIVDWAIAHRRSMLLLLLFLFISGITAYQEIPKESEPDIAIPIVYVSMSHEGISPEDAERLLVRPMEKRAKVDRRCERNEFYRI